jgi:hypothetical protein
VPFVIPSTVQVTAVFVAPETVAVTDRVDPAVNVVVPGFRATLTEAAAWTVMAQEADLLESTVLVAVKVWFPAVAGAV